MSTQISKHLTLKQLNALQKVGNIIIPNNPPFTEFSRTGCIGHIDEILLNAHPDDIKDLKLLLNVLHVTPTAIIKWLLYQADHAERYPKLIATALRMFNLGIKGIIFSLYYSGKTRIGAESKSAHIAIDYQLNCHPIESE